MVLIGADAHAQQVSDGFMGSAILPQVLELLALGAEAHDRASLAELRRPRRTLSGDSGLDNGETGQGLQKLLSRIVVRGV
jgi:hypothetical protein